MPCAWLNAEQLFIEDEHSLGCPAGKRGALPFLRRSPSKTPQQAQALGAPAEKAGAQPRWRQADPRVSPNTVNSHWGCGTPSSGYPSPAVSQLQRGEGPTRSVELPAWGQFC